MENQLYARDTVGVHDAVWLENFTDEDTFIDNLEKRFKANFVYTYIGPVLISVNPYRELGIYSKERVQQYKNVNFFEVPPHVFAVADTAYRSLKGENRDQCVLISGESGAGKTEASKRILEYVANVSGHSVVAKVKEMLLQSNPLLEAFGNATTTRNDNSSRFGKYMDIAFDFKGEPVGGHILSYLLEKSRVVHQAPGERNFHIFYQLLAGASEETLAKMHLTRDIKSFQYMNGENMATYSLRLPDASQWKVVEHAMETCGLFAEEKDNVLSTVAGILHLGNVQLIEGQNSYAAVVADEALKMAAELFGCTAKSLEAALTHRTIEARGEFVTTPLNKDQGHYARDALAKATYSRVFTWLVERINKSLRLAEETAAPPGARSKRCVMGILDIYGFEIFKTNSFEQFCINYCNEKLHQVFIELTLKSEQEEYLREGIQWTTIEYFDNKPICQMIETVHKGIISFMDEECMRPGDPTDATFLYKMRNSLGNNHKFFKAPQPSVKRGSKNTDQEFVLVHYAGQVTYNITGFLDKNNDLLFRDLKDTMSKANNEVVKAVFPTSELEGKKRPETAATQFKTSVNNLISILMSKEPSYVRCIKPNDFKRSGDFNTDIVAHQVRYLGLMENLRVRRAGFAYRRNYELFLERYKSLCPETWPKYRGPAKEGVKIIMQKYTKGPQDYQMGETKVFIRESKTLFAIEDAFQRRKHELASKIQATYKGRLQKRKYLQMKAAVTMIAKHWKRVLAVRELAKRKKAVKIIRGFIKGFIQRNSPAQNLDQQALKFLQMVKVAWLIKLSKNLPSKILHHKWMPAPHCCKEASEQLRQLHLRILVRKYIKSLTPQRKRLLQRKVRAEALFKGKKQSYEASIPIVFQDNRLTPELENQRKTSFESVVQQANEKTLYCVPVSKYDRHGLKKRDRVLVVTSGTLYILDAEKLKIKQRISLQFLKGLTLTNKKDNLFILRPTVPEGSKKEKAEVAMEAPEGTLIELAVHVAEAVGNNDVVQVESASTLTYSIGGGKQGMVDISQGHLDLIVKKEGRLRVIVSS